MVAIAVVISGIPTTGKTTVANKLRDKGYTVKGLFKFAEEHDCIDDFDEDRDSHVVDGQALYDRLGEYLKSKEGIIVFEGHYGDLVPNEFVSQCFVLQVDTATLKERLEERGYDEQKVEENIEAGIFQVCWVDAVDEFGQDKVRKIENTDLEKTTSIIHRYLEDLEQSQK